MAKQLLLRLLLCGAALLPAAALAWWQADWTQRTRITLDTGASGVPIDRPLNGWPLAVRLHSGNFDFLAAKADGSDLRVLASDDKTPLPFRVERFDPVNELAVLWVTLPTVAAGSDANVVHVYAGNPAAAAEAPPAGAGADAAPGQAVFRFSDPAAADAGGTLRPEGTPVPDAGGLLGGALRLAGQPLAWPAGERLRAAAGGALTLSAWLRSDAAPAGTPLAQGPLAITLDGGRLGARVGTLTLAGPVLAPGTWMHVALVVGDGRARLYADGAEVAAADAALPALDAPLRLGDGFSGLVDELRWVTQARPAAWLALDAATQGVGARGIIARLEREGEADADVAGGGSHLGVLVDNLTLDAWVVIVILAVMFVVAAWVMVTKTISVTRADGENQAFLERFRAADDDLLALAQDTSAGARSPLFRLYVAGVRELAKRQVGAVGAPPLSGASLDAVKAAVDADLVRESHRLNAHMVLLTIAISGGPFLGLLGTVVGVMITFAAIAAAGDVNVNAIAPGIAAALLATVAGLAVAIPALFGYNWLASRIKNISADMQIFVDEFVTRVAERYGAR